ncbi:uncharacterized protein EAF01_004013 [Botrytis porri]|uniref:Helicase ATP-binding domain-containing protein n=1 Tax=Botrytis porri TaxID=87229 RepID=A0A4Z1KDJ0_9HELO|nr:uncharacterized protein EAF01_004013 [Botrytis porri]KAF7908258.1 hypothetical protein EAF01_004013 [Botrytis porri]TGO83418.1 hypothetical protein BPOR_0651g00010 [Botrytis porri]
MLRGCFRRPFATLSTSLTARHPRHLFPYSPDALPWTSLGQKGDLPHGIGLCIRSLAHVAAAATESIPDETVAAVRGIGPPRPLLPPSPEQQIAIDTLLHTKKNIIVDACAGSGKTTTILHLAQSSPDTKFLVLVYNRRLMLETKQRIEDLGLTNVTVQNYHTLGARYYTSECATDQGLKRVVEDDMTIFENTELPEFSVLILDEQQDMTPILKRFVDKVLRDKGFIGPNRQPKAEQPLRVVVLGDRRQEVYGFNNADSRFLSMANRPEVFGYINDQEWVLADQTASNRMTQSNVDFINQQLLKDPSGKPMRAVKSHDASGRPFPQPRYVICDPYDDLVHEVQRLLEFPGISPNDIIVLSPSVRGVSPAIYLANDLALRGIPVFRSDSDISEIAPEVAHGKVLICTYHQAKGIERKASIVLGFDQAYHDYFNKVSEDPIVVTNPQYVAATRALEHLVLVHAHTNAPLPFVDLDTVHETCDLVMTRNLNIQPPGPERKTPKFGVTALCRNVSETLITNCLSRLEFKMHAEPTYGSSPPPSEIQDIYGLVEAVAAITGTAIPAIFEWRQKKRLAILAGPLKLLAPPQRPTKRRNPLRELPKEFYERIRHIGYALEAGVITTGDLLYLSNLEMAAKDKDITKLLSIPLMGYTWVSEAYCKDIQYVLNTLPGDAKISGRGIFFESMRYRKFLNITHGGGPTNPQKKLGIIVGGAMDICRPKKEIAAVWEIKHSDSLSPEHLLQVALYMLLLGEKSSGFLVSARTGQTVQVLPKTSESLMQILQLLVDSKSGGEQSRLLNTYSDEEFLEECERDFGGLVGKCALPAWFSMKPSGSRVKKGVRKRKENMD